ncbi:CHAT domain-containing protein [Calothrix rhizosoleniae]|uniref:CHAT domain-containing protein n=1 Tax=Calothrix rhizosoleniae TaxID=888997 RepID=UPI000B497559|nr:CHAT domain-containing protein [Calothrix rhizosoleniae]
MKRHIKYSVCIGLLTLFITTGFPALARTDFKLKLNTNNSLSSSIVKRTENPQSLFNQGKNLLESGRFTEAAQFWERAAANFQKQGNIINQAWSLNYLSLSYQNLGKWQQAKNAITHSLNLLQKQQENTATLAVAFNIQGSLQIAMGETEAALQAWQNAAKAYKSNDDPIGEIGSKINQVQALQALGLYHQANKLLANINGELQNQPDSLLKVKGLQSLGEALQTTGDIKESQTVLTQGLAIAKKLNSQADTSKILLSLGNVARNLQQTPTALDYYKQAAATATNSNLQVEARLNQLSLHIDNKQWQPAQSLLKSIKPQLASLTPSRTSVYASVNFATSLSRLAKQDNQDKSTIYQDSAQILARALKQADNLGDLRAKAYALNELGKLYQQTKQLPEALKLSQQALQISQSLNAGDISYQAAWQVGQILKQKGNNQGAIAAYDSALKTLKTLRGDLVAVNRGVQFSFQEKVEPIYREFVSLLLSDEDKKGEISQKKLKQARDTIEALQLAELDNFFQEACLNAKPQQIDQIDPTAAVIYPIILPDRVEVILSISGKPLSHYQTLLSKSEVEKSIQQMRRALNPVLSDRKRLRLYQQLYDWLIRPAESQLANSGIKTLAFVLDGSLRNLPMAALYDGKQYLVEKYSIALSPGMQLLQGKSLQEEKLKVITAAVSEARQGFKALPGVKTEVKQISAKVATKELLNERFTDTNLQDVIQTTPFSVLHLATHGQFSSSSDDTFILTWDGKIKVKQLDELFQRRNKLDSMPVELMVLSACQTAKGDNRAILGLAGVAVRSGARSTLATLWSVKDESTSKFMAEFYKQLSKPGANKAEAVRQTQINFLKDPDFQHPFYWAPFVLVGNWV